VRATAIFPVMNGRLFALAAMRVAAAPLLALLSGALMFSGAPAAAQPAPTAAAAPIVVELYTSQGCFSCPRANRLLGEFSREDDLLALTFPVGYWDYLGWNDTFAQPEFSERQRDFGRALRFRGVYTPQIVVNGVRHVSAADWDQARGVVEDVRALPRPSGAPSLSVERLNSGQVRAIIGGATRADPPADVWFVSFDPGPLTVLITAGENINRRVAHYNLVRRVQRVGAWDGTAAWYERGRCTPQCAVIVQAPNGGPILAAAYTRRQRR